VLTYVSEPLKHSLTITGPIKAVLFAATSGTDTDFIVKLIDVYPENYQGQSGEGQGSAATYRASLNGYELPIAMEIRRGRYLKSFSHPMALKPGVVTKWVVPLGDHDHVFLAGHRIMVQIQSSWFPLYDVNPQKFVPNIYLADRSDYSKAIERVYSSGIDASRIVLPVVPSAAPGN
jgi:putative CocE/NonD family hydrolase